MVEQASKIGNGAVLISIRSTVDFFELKLVLPCVCFTSVWFEPISKFMVFQ